MGARGKVSKRRRHNAAGMGKLDRVIATDSKSGKIESYANPIESHVDDSHYSNLRAKENKSAVELA